MKNEVAVSQRQEAEEKLQRAEALVKEKRQELGMAQSQLWMEKGKLRKMVELVCHTQQRCSCRSVAVRLQMHERTSELHRCMKRLQG